MKTNQRTYKAVGINLKAIPMGESDRLVTVLTKEHGLLRVIAPGARKHKSRLGGRSGLFVVNELLITKGKSLDKMIQAETLRSFPKLSGGLARLTASQYLAELILCEAVTDQPQEALFCLLVEHLERLEQAPDSAVLACLAQATFHVLALAGVAPELYQCCVTRQRIQPDLGDPHWQIGFSLPAGGTVLLAELTAPTRQRSELPLTLRLNAAELALLQQLGQSELVLTQAGSLPSIEGETGAAHDLWRKIERVLRHYAQYHFDRPIRSALLIDTCFALPAYAS
ncbi:MAG: DNA repair protein RecO [Leptolyngbya sp. SIO4C1]|nr:DNA repair protein RecO [Leptolyngbya sp. SIO4C1]